MTSVRDIIAELGPPQARRRRAGGACSDQQEDSGALASDRVRADKVRRPRRVLFDSSFLIAVMEHPTPWQEDILEKVGAYEGVVLAARLLGAQATR